MNAIDRAYNYIYQLYTKPITIQECDAMQLLHILADYENVEYIIEQLKDRVEIQLFRESLRKNK